MNLLDPEQGSKLLEADGQDRISLRAANIPSALLQKTKSPGTPFAAHQPAHAPTDRSGFAIFIKKLLDVTIPMLPVAAFLSIESGD